ncbi:hypothetical protein TNCV_4828171 [Trichonephila clavipes]|uniref:Uncharacterized protein n=1 Tax=Trichonephila clavipes TaxID=2585209 RepID=A0A8X6VJ14_TRICX|nr:hypothetical protein TNCV_4828171 [Trichonephila clavipes]
MIHLKRQLGANELARLCAHKPITDTDVEGLPIPVAVDQRAANGHSPPSGAGVDRRAQASPSVVHCQFFKLFVTRRSTASKLTTLWDCSTAHELLLRNRKILLLEGR